MWGPPGTGKTTVIGQIIDELYKHDRSVLVVSHTNTAVDGAIEKADKTYFKSNPISDISYPILRIGTPAKPLPDRVLLAQHVATLGKELYEQKASLEKQQSELQHRINEITPLLAKDTWIKESNLDAIGKALQRIGESGAEEIKHEGQPAWEKLFKMAKNELDEISLNDMINKNKYKSRKYGTFMVFSISTDKNEYKHYAKCIEIRFFEKDYSTGRLICQQKNCTK